MAIVETLAAKSINENFLQKVASVAVGACSTLWIGFAVCLYITNPITIAGRVGEYLGFEHFPEKLLPAAEWAADPKRLQLFIGAAVIAGILFNIGATPILTARHSAPHAAWLFFLFAVQGAGFWTTMGTCAAVSVLAFAFSWISTDGPRDKTLSRIVLIKNIYTNIILMFYPLSLLVMWFFASYRGDLPADSSREHPQPTGAAPVPSRPIR
ncbi:hypothetical protein OG943_32770 [Amycolatopsis sp. NBC_00345]|uniref:hypothetical protein n=1 Tax=Amycolatopsis sp. NBC_00345 TaxID=2975955 RepID=UPI002E254882